MMGRELTF